MSALQFFVVTVSIPKLAIIRRFCIRQVAAGAVMTTGALTDVTKFRHGAPLAATCSCTEGHNIRRSGISEKFLIILIIIAFPSFMLKVLRDGVGW